MAKSKSISETDKAYLAGIIDGEGSIGISKYHLASRPFPAHNARLIVGQANEKFIRGLQDKWGVGSVTCVKDSGVGHRPFFKWEVSSKSALVVLESVLPYLTIKKLQAEGAVELERSKGRRGGKKLTIEEVEYREWVRKKISDLNQGALCG